MDQIMKSDGGECSKAPKSKMMAIFASDLNGIEACDVNNDEVVITALESYQRAYKNIDDTNPAIYYTCKYCKLLFKHPKRFLIHCKWHQMHTDSLKQQAALAFKKVKTQKKKSEGEGSDNSKSDDEDFDESKKICWSNKKCEFCNVPLTTMAVFKEHFETVHKVDGLFKCPFCDKKYRHKFGWMRHAYSHKEPTLECPECPKKFALKQLLDQHVRTHIEPRKRTKKCSYCGRGFYDLTALEIHERAHRKEKVHQCQVCDKYYSSNGVLKKHIKMVHSKVKAFSCDLAECQRTFATEFLKRIHMQREHGAFGERRKKTFPCKICGLVLDSKYELKKHRLGHRNGTVPT